MPTQRKTRSADDRSGLKKRANEKAQSHSSTTARSGSACQATENNDLQKRHGFDVLAYVTAYDGQRLALRLKSGVPEPLRMDVYSAVGVRIHPVADIPLNEPQLPARPGRARTSGGRVAA